MLPFARVAIIGMGLIGSSLARAIRAAMPTVQIVASDADAAVRERVAELGLADDVADGAGAAVVDADLVILCVPVGAMAAVAAEIAPELSPDTVVSDVGSVKESVARVLGESLPGVHVIPAHPVAGTEKSGPDAGFASLFQGRWCIITPPPRADAVMVERLSEFWRRLGARVELMDAAHHDRVLAVTSHLPHLIAYSIVGTASDLEAVTKAEVIKYSAGGFRDFTRMWPCSAPSAGVKVTRWKPCSPAPARSAAASSTKARTPTARISAGRIEPYFKASRLTQPVVPNASVNSTKPPSRRPVALRPVPAPIVASTGAAAAGAAYMGASTAATKLVRSAADGTAGASSAPGTMAFATS